MRIAALLLMCCLFTMPLAAQDDRCINGRTPFTSECTPLEAKRRFPVVKVLTAAAVAGVLAILLLSNDDAVAPQRPRTPPRRPDDDDDDPDVRRP